MLRPTTEEQAYWEKILEDEGLSMYAGVLPGSLVHYANELTVFATKDGSIDADQWMETVTRPFNYNTDKCNPGHGEGRGAGKKTERGRKLSSEVSHRLWDTGVHDEQTIDKLHAGRDKFNADPEKLASRNKSISESVKESFATGRRKHPRLGKHHTAEMKLAMSWTKKAQFFLKKMRRIQAFPPYEPPVQIWPTFAALSERR
jgi:hypothetical protein